MELKKEVYDKSNAITSVCVKTLSSKYATKVLESEDACDDRQRNAQALTDYLCKRFGITTVKVLVTPKKRVAFRNGNQRWGFYVVGHDKITIYNTTAKTNKVVGIKTFYGTLLHEFVHHYDIEKIGLADSYHTKGFYLRINDLKNKMGV